MVLIQCINININHVDMDMVPHMDTVDRTVNMVDINQERRKKGDMPGQVNV